MKNSVLTFQLFLTLMLLSGYQVLRSQNLKIIDNNINKNVILNSERVEGICNKGNFEFYVYWEDLDSSLGAGTTIEVVDSANNNVIGSSNSSPIKITKNNSILTNNYTFYVRVSGNTSVKSQNVKAKLKNCTVFKAYKTHTNTTEQNYNTPEYTKEILFHAIGGGGNGGKMNNNGADKGGGGGGAAATIKVINPASVYKIKAGSASSDSFVKQGSNFIVKAQGGSNGSGLTGGISGKTNGTNSIGDVEDNGVNGTDGVGSTGNSNSGKGGRAGVTNGIGNNFSSLSGGSTNGGAGNSSGIKGKNNGGGGGGAHTVGDGGEGGRGVVASFPFFDNIRPTITSFTRTTSATNYDNLVSKFKIVFSENTTSFVAKDVSVISNKNYTTTTSGSGKTYFITVTSTQNNEIKVSVPVASVYDLAGNLNSNASVTFTNLHVIKAPGGVSQNLAVWLRADASTYSDNDGSKIGNTAVSSNGTAINAWEDLSGRRSADATSRDATIIAPTLINNLADNTNFNPALDFSGDSSGFKKGLTFSNSYVYSPTVNKGIAIFTVTTPQVSSSDGVLLEFGKQIANGNNKSYGVRLKNNAIHVGVLGETKEIASTDIAAAGKPILLNYLVDYNHATGGKVYKNGSSIPIIEHSTVGVIQLNSAQINESENRKSGSGPFTLGISARNTTSKQYDGTISEVIVMDYDINDAGFTNSFPRAKERIESYLAIKYGISRGNENYYSSNNTEIWTKSGSTNVKKDYEHAVFGLGRDDKTFLNQKISRSNEDDLITFSLEDNYTTPNVNRASTFNGDKKFIIAASNNLTEDWNSAKPCACSEAEFMSKNWRVQSSNNPNSIYVAVPVHKISSTLSKQPDQEIYLVISNSEDFKKMNFIKLTIDPTGQYYSGLFKFKNTQYFTLAKVSPKFMRYKKRFLFDQLQPYKTDK